MSAICGLRAIKEVDRLFSRNKTNKPSHAVEDQDPNQGLGFLDAPLTEQEENELIASFLI